MTAALDRPATLSHEHPACAMHELVGGQPCGRPATLTVVVHQCRTAPSCGPCWEAYRQSIKSGAVRCKLCQRSAMRLQDLVWVTPL